MKTISQRIKELIDSENLNISSFEKKIDVGNNSIGTILKRNSNVSGDILSKILNSFENLNANWLITGKGKMYIENNIATDVATNIEPTTEREIYLSKEVISLLKEKTHDLEKQINALNNTSNAIDILKRIENEVKNTTLLNKVAFTRFEEHFEYLKLKENLENAKRLTKPRKDKDQQD